MSTLHETRKQAALDRLADLLAVGAAQGIGQRRARELACAITAREFGLRKAAVYKLHDEVYNDTSAEASSLGAF